MTNPNEAMLNALRDVAITTEFLIKALEARDLDKAHEAVSIMLMQGMNQFGPQSAVMKQFFPVWDAIKRHIDQSDTDSALGQARLWSKQLQEVISIVQG